MCTCMCACVKGKDVSYLKQPAAGLVRLALDRWQLRGMRADNISAIVILLNPSSSNNDDLHQSVDIPLRRDSVRPMKDVLRRIQRTRNPRHRIGLRTVLGKICRLRAQRCVLRSPLGACNNQRLFSSRDSGLTAKPEIDRVSEMPTRQISALQQPGRDFTTAAKPTNDEMFGASLQGSIQRISTIQNPVDFTIEEKPTVNKKPVPLPVIQQLQDFTAEAKLTSISEVPLKRHFLLRRHSYQEACNDSYDNLVAKASDQRQQLRVLVRRLTANVCQLHSYKGLSDSTVAAINAEGPQHIRDGGVPLDADEDGDVVVEDMMLGLSEEGLVSRGMESGPMQLLGSSADARSGEEQEADEDVGVDDGCGDGVMKEWDAPHYRSTVDLCSFPTADEPWIKG